MKPWLVNAIIQLKRDMGGKLVKLDGAELHVSREDFNLLLYDARNEMMEDVGERGQSSVTLSDLDEFGLSIEVMGITIRPKDEC